MNKFYFNETIKSIIFALLGLTVMLYGIFVSTTVDLIVFGGLMFCFGIGCIIYDKYREKHK